MGGVEGSGGRGAAELAHLVRGGRRTVVDLEEVVVTVAVRLEFEGREGDHQDLRVEKMSRLTEV